MLFRPQINQNSPAMETNSNMIARCLDVKPIEAKALLSILSTLYKADIKILGNPIKNK
jgi:hypothetical protein